MVMLNKSFHLRNRFRNHVMYGAIYAKKHAHFWIKQVPFYLLGDQHGPESRERLGSD